MLCQSGCGYRHFLHRQAHDVRPRRHAGLYSAHGLHFDSRGRCRGRGAILAKLGDDSRHTSSAPSAQSTESDRKSVLLMLLPGAYMQPEAFSGVLTRLQVLLTAVCHWHMSIWMSGTSCALFAMTHLMQQAKHADLCCLADGGCGEAAAVDSHCVSHLAGGGRAGPRRHAAGDCPCERLRRSPPGAVAIPGLPCRDPAFRSALLKPTTSPCSSMHHENSPALRQDPASLYREPQGSHASDCCGMRYSALSSGSA